MPTISVRPSIFRGFAVGIFCVVFLIAFWFTISGDSLSAQEDATPQTETPPVIEILPDESLPEQRARERREARERRQREAQEAREKAIQNRNAAQTEKPENVEQTPDRPEGQADPPGEPAPVEEPEDPVERNKRQREQKLREEEERLKEEEAKKAEEAGAAVRMLPVVDRATDRRLEQVRLLISRERFAEAAELLAVLMEQGTDVFLKPPDSEKANPTNRTTLFRRLHALYELLPEEGRALFAVRQEPRAERLLRMAVEQGSLDLLRDVVRRHETTAAGREAAFLLGMYQFEQGHYAAALRTFRRLTGEPSGDAFPSAPDLTASGSRERLERYEPMLSLALVACQLRLGLDLEAQSSAEAFWRRYPAPKLNGPDGRPWLPVDAGEIVAKLRETGDQDGPDLARWLENTGWLLPHGTAWQQAEVRASTPLLEKTWAVPIPSNIQVDAAIRMILQTLTFQRDAATIPAGEPLLVGTAMILRGYDETFAVDAVSGKRLWRVREPEFELPKVGGEPLSGMHMTSREERYYTPTTLVVRSMFWHNRIYNSLSSDGERFYQVDGLDFQVNSHFGGRQHPLNVQGVSMDDPRVLPGNTLVAREVRTGRLLWQSGKAPYVKKRFDEFAERVEDAVKKKRTVDEERKRRREEGRNDPVEKDDPFSSGKDASEKDASDQKGETKLAETPAEKPFEPTVVISEEERFLGEQIFLGAPLPLDGRLYVMAESGGVIRLLVLEGRDGRLLERIPLIEPRTIWEDDLARRFYGMTPAAAQGIVVCPTGAEAVAGVDALTLEPLWCFSYAKNDVQEDNRPGGGFGMNIRGRQLGSGTPEDFARVFANSGWQVPSTHIVGTRVLVAPSDTPALYCLDLLTGRVLWTNEDMKTDGTVFVACIRNDRVYVVTPKSVVALDMENGQALWDDEGLKVVARIRERARLGQPWNSPEALANRNRLTRLLDKEGKALRKSLRFPEGTLPGGTGIHDGAHYYLPLDDGSLLVLDLDEGRIAQHWEPRHLGRFGEDDVRLGNLIALHGSVFSIAPLQTVAFDQLDALRKSTGERLESDPEDPNALIDLGRIARFEDDVPKAIEYFRRSLARHRSIRGVLFFRNLLLESLRRDFPAYRSYAAELSSLASSREELGEILCVQTEGNRRLGEVEDYVTALKQMIRLDTSHTVLVPLEPNRKVRLGRLAAEQIAENTAPTHENREFADAVHKALEPLAETLFDRLAAGDGLRDVWSGALSNEEAATGKASVETTLAGETATEGAIVDAAAQSPDAGSNETVSPWQTSTESDLDTEIRDWQRFLDYFGTFPIAARARENFAAFCAEHRFPLALELIGAVPQQWFDSGFDCGPTDPISESVAAESLGILLRLADCLETLGKPDDAYRCLLAARHLAPENGLVRQSLENPVFEAFRNVRRWPSGRAEGEERATKSESDTTFSVLRNRRGGRFFGQQNGVPLRQFGDYNPFVSPLEFTWEMASERQTLVCRDPLGNETWRLDIPESDPESMRFMAYHPELRGTIDLPGYILSRDHLLLFVRGRQVYAIDLLDTDAVGTPKLIWMKTAGSHLAVRWHQSSVTVQELNAAAQHIQFQPSYSAQAGYFVGKPVHLTSRVVCIQEAGFLSALDPLTGTLLWQRRSDATFQSLTGDEDHLFLLLPESNEVLALDPGTGRELARYRQPVGRAVHVFGPHLVTIRPGGSDSHVLEVSDLRDMLRKRPVREMALQLSPDPTRLAISRFHSEIVRGELTDRSTVRFVHHDRFVATMNTRTDTFRLFDLATRKDVCSPIKPKALHPRREEYEQTDFDVEFVEDDILLLFVERRQIARRATDIPERQRRPNWQDDKLERQQLRGVPGRSVGLGTLMLYNRQAEPCWEKPVEIERWYQLANLPSGLPVMMFGFLARKPPDQYHTVIKLVDKKTGRELYSDLLEFSDPKARQQPPLQEFTVCGDALNREITLKAPRWSWVFRLSDEEPVQEEFDKRIVEPERRVFPEEIYRKRHENVPATNRLTLPFAVQPDTSKQVMPMGCSKRSLQTGQWDNVSSIVRF